MAAEAAGMRTTGGGAAGGAAAAGTGAAPDEGPSGIVVHDGRRFLGWRATAADYTQAWRDAPGNKTDPLLMRKINKSEVAVVRMYNAVQASGGWHVVSARSRRVSA